MAMLLMEERNACVRFN